MLDPDNVVSELVESDNSVSVDINAINFKPTAIEYTWGAHDTIHVKAYYEIWDGNITTPVPLVGEWQIDGIPVARETIPIVQLGGPSSCYFSKPPCEGKDCPDLAIGPFSFHGDCQDRWVPGIEDSYCFCVYIDFKLSSLQLPPGPGPHQITFVFDPDNEVTELDESDNLISINVNACNFKATGIEYTWGINDTIHLTANYEIWGGDIIGSLPLVGEWRVNGIPVSRDSTSIVQLGGPCSCPLSRPPCDGKDCPDLGIGYFALHGDCQDRYVPVIEESYCFCVYIDFKLSAIHLPPAPGPRVITFVLDPDGYAIELDELDNSASLDLNTLIIPLPMNGGWNLVSVPLLQTDYTPSVVFPGKSGSVFEYNTATKQYTTALTLACGKGYWVLYNTPATVDITGSAPGPLTTTVAHAGWSLVGSHEEILPVSLLVFSNGAYKSGSVFRYDSSPGQRKYVTTTVIEPGVAVWVLVQGATSWPCTITIP
jgi:hypothetical protein